MTQVLLEIDDQNELQQLLAFLRRFDVRVVKQKVVLKKKSSSILHPAAKPTRKITDLEAIKREQNYQGFDVKRMDKIIASMNLQDSDFSETPLDKYGNIAKHYKPMAKTTDLEFIIRQQNFKGIDRIEFDKLVAELDIKEPLSDLIKMI